MLRLNRPDLFLLFNPPFPNTVLPSCLASKTHIGGRIREGLTERNELRGLFLLSNVLFRTTIEPGCSLARELTGCGQPSGQWVWRFRTYGWRDLGDTQGIQRDRRL